MENCLCLPDQSDSTNESSVQPSPSKSSMLGRSNYGLTLATNKQHAHYSHRHELPALIPEGDFRFPNEPESSSCSDGHLSDIMPDVAMATASLDQLQLQDQQEMELDLGDGAPRLHGSVAGTAVRHLMTYHRYHPTGTYPHHRSDLQSFHSPMPRFL